VPASRPNRSQAAASTLTSSHSSAPPPSLGIDAEDELDRERSREGGQTELDGEETIRSVGALGYVPS
jgi:hypothetical protein